MMRILSILAFCLVSIASEAAVPFVIDAEKLPVICVEPGLRPFVMRAAQDLAGDIERVFGRRPEVVMAPGRTENAIVLGRNGTGFERYALSSATGNVLRIVGSDDRGVMFGVYRFASDFLGIDPFYYWSDLEPERRTRLDWPDGIALEQGEPAFRYRGWFINDEDFLNGFRPESNGKRKIAYPLYATCFGPELADRIYESAVRAGFNLMVCASYVDILNLDERRLVDVASSRGLYITMHHQEPVGAGALFLDLHFPEMRETTYASHPDLWRKAWQTYVGEWAKVPDVIWQLGLRGRQDRPFWAVMKPGGSWTDWGVESEAEDRRRAGLISQAMAEQEAMIREAVGNRPFVTATQLWMEGADFYRRGLLDVPKNAIVIFSDNCPGLKFQPDIGGVKTLPGGRAYGLYYHLAVVCGNHYCELVPPERTREVLLDARAKGASEFVLVNVSNVRPFLFTLASAAGTLRDGGAFDVAAFRRAWCARRFGPGAAAANRAFDLYFSAYETEFSRDAMSSYGSPRERAPLPLMNDGDMLARMLWQILPEFDRKPKGAAPIANAYAVDPDRLTDVSAKAHDRINQDMYPWLRDWTRYASRAAAQATGFRRCLDQVELAERRMSEPGKSQLFQRLGYPAGHLLHASACLSELTLALAARNDGNRAATERHLAAALAESQARDGLDRRYNAGKWAHWYDRDLKYPYTQLSDKIAKVLKNLRHGVSK